MTFEEFQTKVKRKTNLDRYWYYILCIAIIILSLVLFYFFITQPEKFKGSKIAFYLGAFFLLCLGSSGFYYLPNRYKIVIVDSKLSISKKKEIVAKLILEVGNLQTINPSQYLVFNLKRKWWQSRYVAQLFFDDQRFAFCIQGHDHNGGFLDFGETERKRKMLTTKLTESP
jgi:hypothetical protein